MEADQIKYRRCTAAGCDYKELRGSRQGDFVNGEFVCPYHYADWDDAFGSGHPDAGGKSYYQPGTKRENG